MFTSSIFTKLTFCILVGLSILLISGCEQHQLNPVTVNSNKTLADYPASMTMDNWEDFVYAPQAVIDHHAGIEREKLQKMNAWAPRQQQISSRNNELTGILFRYKKTEGHWQYFSGITVENDTDSDVTSATGRYSITDDGSPVCIDYTTSWTSYVSVLDVIMIQRHILGITPFPEIRHYLAADVNRDGNITSADITQIQQLILGLASTFPNSENVLFVNGDDYLANRFTYTPSVVQALGTNTVCIPQTASFAFRMTIKTGDVSGEL